MSKLLDTNPHTICDCRYYAEGLFEEPACLNKDTMYPWADLNINYYSGRLNLNECPYRHPKTLWQRLWAWIEVKWR